MIPPLALGWRYLALNVAPQALYEQYENHASHSPTKRRNKESSLSFSEQGVAMPMKSGYCVL